MPETPWLDRVRALRIKIWRYVPEVDPQQRVHVGPMADEWRNVMGVGDGITIDHTDATGILMRAVQELADRVDFLEKELANERSHVQSAGVDGRDKAVDAGRRRTAV